MGEHTLVYYVGHFEENEDPQFVILLDNGFILCLDCSGCIEPDEYDILEYFNEFPNIDKILKENLE